MKRSIILICMALICVSASFAQPKTGKGSKPHVATKEYEAIRKGDQFINIMGGPLFPMFTLTPSGLNADTKMNTGGTLNIGYSTFMTKNFALGGMINFSFNSTIGQNIFFFLPVYLQGTYEFSFERIHVPVSLCVGGAFQTYNSFNYFSPAIKPEIGVFYQYNSDWSFGVNAGWTLLPQWYADESKNRVGNFLSLTAGFRYHF